jgi:hypothetical protein
MLLVDGEAETTFVSAHVPPNPLELFDKVSQKIFRYLNGSFQSMKCPIMAYKDKILYRLYYHVANETAIW